MGLGDNDLNSPTDRNVVPSLQLSDFRGQRYPNQFFDLAQQYMPPTIKELFRWCTFYYYNSPLIGATMKKVSRYPITDLIFEDAQDSTRELWETVLTKELKIKEKLIEMNLDFHVYGNCFVSIHLPFTRFLICRSCKESQPIRQWDWTFRGSDFHFSGKCTKCGHTGAVDVKDVPYKDRKAIRIIRWNPENMHIKYNEYTGRYIYMYTVPPKLRNLILRGDKDILEDTPLIVIEAMSKRKMIRLHPENIFHLKSPTLAEQDQGWGKPAIIHVLKDMYYFYTLRRAQEAIALEHIVPLDMIYPLPNAQQDPYIHTDLASWRVQVEHIIRRHRRDPNYKAVVPVPMGTMRIGGDGKMLMLSPELQYLNQTVVGGLGMSAEMLFGQGTTYCLVPDSYVFTSEGMLELQEFCPEDEGMEERNLSVITKDSVEKVLLTHHTSPRPQVKIRTRMGLKLNGSPIHKVWCLLPDMSMDWVELQNIKPGMFTAIKRSPGMWGEGAPSKSLCRLLGHLCSDGSVLDGAVTFRSTDAEDLEDYKSCFKDVFCKDLKIQWRAYEFQKDLGLVESVDLSIYNSLVSMGMYGYQSEKSVPRIIRTANKECVKEFLRALFSGDGCIEDKDTKQSITYASVSEKLLDQVQLLLLNFGIVSRRIPAYDQSCSTLVIHSYNVTTFMEEIGFTLSRKNILYDELQNRDDFRCEENKYPYLSECLRGLRSKVIGNGWINEKTEVNLEKDVYTLKEVAKILGRSNFATIRHIKSGKLKASQDLSNKQHKPYSITKEDLKDFLSNHGVCKRIRIGDTKCELNISSIENIDWPSVKELDKNLYDKFKAVQRANHIWDEVVEVSFCNEEVEMCDLTVNNTPSYVANGIISHNTGSSIQLRMMENDFIQNRSQLIDFVHWAKDKIRIWLSYPNCKDIRFSDFRMADDVQRNQQLIGLNAQGKVSDQTLLAELGYDWEQETQKIIQETQVKNYLMDIQTKGSARSQGEAQIIQANYSKRMQEMDLADGGVAPTAAGAQEPNMGTRDPNMGGQPAPEAPPQDAFSAKVESWANKFMNADPAMADQALAEVKAKMPAIGLAIEQRMNMLRTAPQSGTTGQGHNSMNIEPNMDPLPVKGAPRRAGAM